MDDQCFRDAGAAGPAGSLPLGGRASSASVKIAQRGLIGKSVGEGGGERWLTLVAHELRGAVQARFQRLFAKPQRAGRLLDAELLDHAHHEHHTE
jgi:hypothetical protein